VKREFNGDTKRYEACESDDGLLLVAVDTTCDEELFAELRARTIVGSVQKLRKSAGLVVADKVEVFYEVTSPAGKGAGAEKEGSKKKGKEEKSPQAVLEEAEKLVADALQKHSETILKRLKSPLLPLKLKSKYAHVVATEKIEDSDICPANFTLYLTQPAVVVDAEKILSLCPTALTEAERSSLSDIVAMYLQSMEYENVSVLEAVEVAVDGHVFALKKGVHYFASAVEKGSS
jgi:hypothetical protein